MLFWRPSNSFESSSPPLHPSHLSSILNIESLRGQNQNVGNHGAATPPKSAPTTRRSRRDTTWPFTRRATSGLIFNTHPSLLFFKNPFFFIISPTPFYPISPISPFPHRIHTHNYFRAKKTLFSPLYLIMISGIGHSRHGR